jgi:hypothetical protein
MEASVRPGRVEGSSHDIHLIVQLEKWSNGRVKSCAIVRPNAPSGDHGHALNERHEGQTEYREQEQMEKGHRMEL